MAFKYGRDLEVQRPEKGFPHSSFGNNALWIKMVPRKLVSQTTANRGGTIQTKGYGPTFKFLAPESIAETIGHSWEAYESMQSRLAEKVKGMVKTAEDIGALKKFFKKTDFKTSLKNLEENNNSIGIAASDALANVDLRATIPKTKIDTPLVYESSERREWNLEFNLASFYNAEHEVVNPVKELMKYSSPSLGNNQINIGLPWVFSIRSEPSNLLNVDYCALTSVQPTWKAPFINGFPTSCDLTLTFKDLSPLFMETIEDGGIIEVNKS